jgi:hypothetical protein
MVGKDCQRGGTPPSPRSFGIMGLGRNSRQIFGFKGLICKIFRNKDLAAKHFVLVPNWGGVTAAEVSFRLSKSADNGFCAASESVSGDGRTFALASQIFIFAHGEWDVCEGGHWLDVMNERNGLMMKNRRSP